MWVGGWWEEGTGEVQIFKIIILVALLGGYPGGSPRRGHRMLGKTDVICMSPRILPQLFVLFEDHVVGRRIYHFGTVVPLLLEACASLQKNEPHNTAGSS